jgi:hypothetical protein
MRRLRTCRGDGLRTTGTGQIEGLASFLVLINVLPSSSAHRPHVVRSQLPNPHASVVAGQLEVVLLSKLDGVFGVPHSVLGGRLPFHLQEGAVATVCLSFDQCPIGCILP